MKHNIEIRFLNVKELAKYLNMSEDAIRGWKKEGKIPHSRFGRSIRFDLHEIEKWLKKQQFLSAYQVSVHNN